MKTVASLLLVAALAAVARACPVAAQQAPASPSSAAPAGAIVLPQPPDRALFPFSARYAVFRGGKPLGDATLELVSVPNARWRIDLRIEATHGLMSLANLDLQQSTVFEETDGALRPLSQSTVRRALFSRKQITGTYDWSRNLAQWTGDVKKTRRAPVALQAGDMNALLINLAVLRDAVPGATLHYRFVDDGRARDQEYRVAAAREPQVVDDLAYAALRVERVRGGGNATTFWVVESVPTPIRIVQHDDDGQIELQLVAYQ
ncbi:DUF3144 domain containing protein [Lysobacter dokdonensis DS-58]|uniref:DUF3144 domain containing protein n=1 Tax=Lysobacter dokdonensis DS-58 TaxID=1300345 RepID=A0A0A2WDE4_9GAMM|nr:DUF3108 domain-containing protein [Lysobacter dokdonensis]KGQ17753.1 DUF3144 domain containing protein [Lysobacter dokdonensis DS-58]